MNNFTIFTFVLKLKQSEVSCTARNLKEAIEIFNENGFKNINTNDIYKLD